MTLRQDWREGHLLLWRARQNRKGLLRAERGLAGTRVPIWQSVAYNWWTGALFALGASLFILGSVLTLAQPLFGAPSNGVVAVVFFLGSIPFTTAAYLQHFQAANADAFPVAVAGEAVPIRSVALIGWRPRDVGWISTLTQFLGTLAFNIDTFDALDPPSGWTLQDLVVWLPDLVGSILFLVSGYFAYIEAGHAYWSWDPRDLGWTIASVNLLGCVFFMTSGVLAFVPAGPEPGWIPLTATVHLLLGALCFFAGSLLLMRESRHAG